MNTNSRQTNVFGSRIAGAQLKLADIPAGQQRRLARCRTASRLVPSFTGHIVSGQLGQRHVGVPVSAVASARNGGPVTVDT